MFAPDPNIRFLPAVRDQIVAIIESINQPQVSIPGKPPQLVQGYVVGLRNANGTFSIYAALWLTQSSETVVYVNDQRQVPLEAYRDVEVEALTFLESMGFMVDNLNFRNLTPQGQDELLKRVAVFNPPKTAPVSGVTAAAAPASGKQDNPTVRLARLLSSF